MISKVLNCSNQSKVEISSFLDVLINKNNHFFGEKETKRVKISMLVTASLTTAASSR
ncbi:Hypothetical protein FKW44_019442, partial [Caligus rogercresseyi]